MSQHLLLIEDEDKLREQLVEVLERHGYSVDACEDGMEGLYIGKKYTYDVAVIDLGLPRVPGQEVIERTLALGQPARRLIHLRVVDERGVGQLTAARGESRRDRWRSWCRPRFVARSCRRGSCPRSGSER